MGEKAGPEMRTMAEEGDLSELLVREPPSDAILRPCIHGEASSPRYRRRMLRGNLCPKPFSSRVHCGGVQALAGEMSGNPERRRAQEISRSVDNGSWILYVGPANTLIARVSWRQKQTIADNRSRKSTFFCAASRPARIRLDPGYGGGVTFNAWFDSGQWPGVTRASDPRLPARC